MKKYWQRLEAKIDALSLRERAMAFVIAALVPLSLIQVLLLDPLFAKQRQLSQQMKLDNQQIAAMHAEMQRLIQANGVDPDAVSRARLQALKQQSQKMRQELLGVQKGLVSPDKMASLLEDLLKQNGKLHLTSLKTLPVGLLNDTQWPDAKTAAVKPAGDAVYKHGVELVVQGTYPDIAAYLAQLESMPWQLFWANARLQVETYPKCTLTLTLFTLSLDKQWLNI